MSVCILLCMMKRQLGKERIFCDQTIIIALQYLHLSCNQLLQVKRKDAILTKCFHVFCYDCLRTRLESCLFTYFCDRMHSDNSFLSFLFFFCARYETRQRKCPKCNAAFGASDYHRWVGCYQRVFPQCLQLPVPVCHVCCQLCVLLCDCVSCLSRAQAVHPVRFYKLYFLYVWPLFQLFLLNGVNLIYLLFRLYLS